MFDTLNDFLVWLMSTAGSGAVVSFILERLAFFQKLSEEGKKWFSFGSMASLGISAFLALTYIPVETLQMLTPYFLILASAFGSVFGGELWHKYVNKK